MALKAAIAKNNVDLVRKLLETRVNIQEFLPKQEDTPITFAIRYGHFECVYALLTSRLFDVNERGRHGYTPLIVAIYYSDECRINYSNECRILKLLCDHRFCDLDATVIVNESCGDTPLIIATRKQKLDMLRCLLLAKSNVDVEGAHGCTALSTAARLNDVAIVKLLQQYSKNKSYALSLYADNALLVSIAYDNADVMEQLLPVERFNETFRFNLYHGIYRQLLRKNISEFRRKELLKQKLDGLTCFHYLLKILTCEIKDALCMNVKKEKTELHIPSEILDCIKTYVVGDIGSIQKKMEELHETYSQRSWLNVIPMFEKGFDFTLT